MVYTMRKLLLLGMIALAPMSAKAWDSTSFGFNANVASSNAGSTNGQYAQMPNGGSVSAGSMEQAFSTNRGGTNGNGVSKSTTNTGVIGQGFVTGTNGTFGGEWSVGSAYGAGWAKNFSAWSQPGF